MHLILPLTKSDRKSFRRSAVEMGFDEFVVHKFLYSMRDSDLDIFQLMHDERISLLIYCWEMLDMYLQNSENKTASNIKMNRNVAVVAKWLVRYTLDLWLSREWDSCEYQMRKAIIHCVRRAQNVLENITPLSHFCWPEILKWDIHPWQQQYVSHFLKIPIKTKQWSDQSIEDAEPPANKTDIEYLRGENVFIIVMRLIKMVDGFNLEGAKQLAMRVIVGWNAVYERAKDIPGNNLPQIPEEYKQCIISICHVYLLAVYEMDSNRGFIIDNMMNNIRFYYQSFLARKFERPFATISSQLSFTPALFIALTCVNINISINTFLDIFTSHGVERNFSTLFGVISQSYSSYILGNQLMEMNHMNEEHFNENIERYKSIFNAYIEEREISEMFLKDQMKRKQMQKNSHSMSPVVKNITDIESKFCKGNRAYNMEDCAIGGVESETEENAVDRKTDAVFENMPNNEEILNYVYRMLAKRTYNGWYFAKIVLLLKIIGHEVNVIETWRYHPGLTTDFMLSIENKLARHYEDLALIFHAHFFLEQEFWLTAFYLNPIRKYYTAVLRCGVRWKRKLHHAEEDGEKIDKSELGEKSAKYGLLSSTIDVKDILKLRNHDAGDADYDALGKSLSALKLSSKTIKDLLTVIFLPRNKSFSWALEWMELRKRCKKLMKYPDLKRCLVELNMAEANDRLKYLNIDYEKYRNRPQLDYGTIEQGYEGLMNFVEQDQGGDDSDDDDEDVDEANLGLNREHFDDVLEAESKGTGQDVDELADIYGSETRRTRARTAAAIATATLGEDPSKVDQPQKPDTFKNETSKDQDDGEIKPPESALHSSPIPKPNEESNYEMTEDLMKRNLNELLQESSVYSNETTGFGSIINIWEFDANVLNAVDTKSAVLEENRKLCERYAVVKKIASMNSDIRIAGTNVYLRSPGESCYSLDKIHSHNPKNYTINVTNIRKTYLKRDNRNVVAEKSKEISFQNSCSIQSHTGQQMATQVSEKNATEIGNTTVETSAQLQSCNKYVANFGANYSPAVSVGNTTLENSVKLQPCNKYDANIGANNSPAEMRDSCLDLSVSSGKSRDIQISKTDVEKINAASKTAIITDSSLNHSSASFEKEKTYSKGGLNNSEANISGGTSTVPDTSIKSFQHQKVAISAGLTDGKPKNICSKSNIVSCVEESVNVKEEKFHEQNKETTIKIPYREEPKKESETSFASKEGIREDAGQSTSDRKSVEQSQNNTGKITNENISHDQNKFQCDSAELEVRRAESVSVVNPEDKRYDNECSVITKNTFLTDIKNTSEPNTENTSEPNTENTLELNIVNTSEVSATHSFADSVPQSVKKIAEGEEIAEGKKNTDFGKEIPTEIPTHVDPSQEPKTATTATSLNFTKSQIETSDEANEGKAHQFKPREVVVLIKRLKVTDFSGLRQPRVCVSRIRSDKTTLQLSKKNDGVERNKKDCVKSVLDTSKSNKCCSLSSHSPKLRTYQRRKYKQRNPQSSTALGDEASKTSCQLQTVQPKVTKRRYKPTGRAEGRPKKLRITTKRSGGPKMRISRTPASTVVGLPSKGIDEDIELIQISSSSTSPSRFPSSDEGEIDPMDLVRPFIANRTRLNANLLDDPLYEEEIFIFD